MTGFVNGGATGLALYGAATPAAARNVLGSAVVRAEDYMSAGQTATQRRVGLQAALDECGTSGRYLSIPSGTYAVDGERLNVPAGVIVESRRGLTKLQTSVDRAATKPVIQMAGNYAKLSGIMIESTFAGTPTISDTNAAIVITGNDCVVEGFDIAGRFYVGITNRECARTLIADGRVRGVRNRGVYNYLNVTDVLVRGVNVDGNGLGTSTPYTDYGFNTNPGGSVASNIRYRDCVVRNYGFHGVSLSERCGPGSVHGCHVETSSATGVGFVLQDANGYLLEDGMMSMNSAYGGLVGFYTVGSMFSIINTAIARNQSGSGSAGFVFVDTNYAVATGLVSRQFGAQSGVQLTATAADSMRRTMVGPAVTLGASYGAFLTGAATNATRDIVLIGFGAYGASLYGVIADANVDRLAVAGLSARGSGTANMDITGATNTTTAATMTS